MNTRKFHLPGEAALLIVLLINPLAIDLMSKSVFGISTISSVPLILSTAFPVFSFGTWNYIFQTLLVITLMVLKRSFCPGYLFSFVVGIGFGKMIDVHNTWVTLLPNVLSLNVVCFFTGFLLMCFGICLANNCLLPIVPTDIFPRDLSELLHKKYNQIKTTFDLTCLTTTVILSLVILHHLNFLLCFYDGTNRISGSKIHWKSCRILPSDEKRNGNAWEKDAPCIKKLPEFQFFC